MTNDGWEMVGRLRVVPFVLARFLAGTLGLVLVLAMMGMGETFFERGLELVALVGAVAITFQPVYVARTAEPRFGIAGGEAWCTFAPLNLKKRVAVSRVVAVRVRRFARSIVLATSMGPDRNSGLVIPWRWVQLDSARTVDLYAAATEIAAALGVPVFEVRGGFVKRDVPLGYGSSMAEDA